MKKNIAILGSTGSIGRQAIDVAKRRGYGINAIAFGSNCGLGREQILSLKPEYCAVSDVETAKMLSDDARSVGTKLFSGAGCIEEMLSEAKSDVCINGIGGFGGLLPTISAIKYCGLIGLANKESLVATGDIVKSAAKEYGKKIIPVDSEHSAIFQCLKLGDEKELSSVTLTASGGAFRDFDQKMLETVTPEMATTHPVWKMGKKVTVDSATLMNKGLEVVEAARFFDLPASKIKVLMHRESVIHGMASFTDGSVVAVLGKPDMRVPIGLSLSWPERFETGVRPPDLSDYGELHFSKPDFEKYSSLRLAYEAEDKGEIAVIAMSAADEVAVKLFLDQKISFTDIPKLVSVAVESAETGNAADFNDVLSIDRYTREYILKKAGF